MLINKLKNLFFKENFYRKKSKEVLGNIIQLSKSDIFFDKYKISRDFLSRFEIIIIHIFLLSKRLETKKDKKKSLQFIYNYFFEYIDFSLREMGVGDLSVGKKVKILATKFSTRMINYEKYSENNLNTIDIPIKKFIYKESRNKSIVKKFSLYIKNQNIYLEKKSLNKIFSKNCFSLRNLK